MPKESKSENTINSNNNILDRDTVRALLGENLAKDILTPNTPDATSPNINTNTNTNQNTRFTFPSNNVDNPNILTTNIGTNAQTHNTYINVNINIASPYGLTDPQTISPIYNITSPNINTSANTNQNTRFTFSNSNDDNQNTSPANIDANLYTQPHNTYCTNVNIINNQNVIFTFPNTNNNDDNIQSNQPYNNTHTTTNNNNINTNIPQHNKFCCVTTPKEISDWKNLWFWESKLATKNELEENIPPEAAKAGPLVVEDLDTSTTPAATEEETEEETITTGDSDDTSMEEETILTEDLSEHINIISSQNHNVTNNDSDDEMSSEHSHFPEVSVSGSVLINCIIL